MAHENKYLQELVGDALARGCAATVTSQPNDAVEYLALWLLRYVKNAEVEGEFYKSKQDDIDAQKAKLAASLRVNQQTIALHAEKTKALQALAERDGEPRQLLKAAVDLIKKYTSAGAVYAANVAEPEEPDWTPPEDLEDPNYETEDEQDQPTQAAGDEAAAEAESSQTAADAAAAAAAAAEEGGEAVEGVPGGGPKRRTDYSKKYFSYVVSSAGQEFVANTELRRPGPVPDDAGEDFVPPPIPATFRILDDRQPLLYVPNVAFDPAVTFFRNFPKIGAYIAAAVRNTAPGAADPSFCCVLAADTLFPEGHGQELSKEEQDFVWEASLAVSKALDRSLLAAATATAKNSGGGAEQLAALKSRVGEIVSEHLEAAAELSEEPPAPEEGDPEAEVAAVAAPDAEAEGEAQSPEAVVDAANAKVAKLTIALAYSEWKAQRAAHTLSEGKAVHKAITEALLAVKDRALFSVHHALTVPQATCHALKALLLLLGETPAEVATWKRVQRKVTAEFFDQAAAYDGVTGPRNMDVWKTVRSAYRAASVPKALETDFPTSALGTLTVRLIKSIRKVANRAAASRAAERMVNDQLEQLDKARDAVVAATDALAVATEKAEQDRIEAEAAAEAAAAAEAGEEGAAAPAEGEE